MSEINKLVGLNKGEKLNCIRQIRSLNEIIFCTISNLKIERREKYGPQLNPKLTWYYKEVKLQRSALECHGRNLSKLDTEGLIHSDLFNQVFYL